MCSKIMMVSTTSELVDTDGIIPLTTISRRTGNVLANGTNTILASRPCYYKVNAIVTFTGSAAGDAILSIQKNGIDIQGLTAIETVGTADTEVHSLSIAGLVRVFPSDGTASLSLINKGVGITSLNVAMTVEVAL